MRRESLTDLALGILRISLTRARDWEQASCLRRKELFFIFKQAA